jgi:hypothetical protein
MELQWNDTDRVKLKNLNKTCPITILSTTNPTITDLGANLGLLGNRATKPPQVWHGHSDELLSSRVKL